MQHILSKENSNLTKLWTIIEGEINLERGKPIAMIHLEFSKSCQYIGRKQQQRKVCYDSKILVNKKF